MPIIFDHSPNPKCRIAIWQITETMDELEDALHFIPELESKLSDFKLDARKLEWICTRVLVKHLIPELEQVNIIYDIHGKPHLESKAKGVDYFISISHTRNNVAVIVCEESQVGVDIETIHERIIKISKRFINEEEMNAIAEDALEHMHVLWGAKEVIYKIYSVGDLSFQDEIFINRFIYKGKGTLKGFILKDNFAESYSLNYKKINDLMLVYGSSN
jgi:phosphopantetheinyl transferase